MSGIKQFWSDFFTGAKEAGIIPVADAPVKETRSGPDAEAAPVTATAPAPDPDRTAHDARVAALEVQLAQARAAEIVTRSAAFADGAIRDRRAFPAERAALVAAYTQAAQDDDRAPVADGQQTRVAQIEALAATRPQHSLSEEVIASGAGGVLPDGGTPKQMTAERRRALLAMTPLGQAVLAKETKSA